MSIFADYTNKKFYEPYFVVGYKTRFERMVTKLLALTDEHGEPPTLETRKAAIEAICDAYLDRTGEVPDGAQVQRLANWLLLEDLTNSHPDKVTREEYPFMTKRQMRTRYNRELADENIPETHTIQKYLGGKKQASFNKAE